MTTLLFTLTKKYDNIKNIIIKNMIILAIESSCDDTSISLLEIDKNNIKILAEKTASQIEIHKKLWWCYTRNSS